MRKRTLGFAAGLALAGLVVGRYVVGMPPDQRPQVDAVARDHDPRKMQLERMGTNLISGTIDRGTTAGLVRLADGSEVAFWFMSPHVHGGLGITRFDAADGRTAYLTGHFCCEVMVPETRDWDELVGHIAQWDGRRP